MILGVSEILKKASEIHNDNERAVWLQAHNSIALETILRGIYDPSIVWLLPEGAPPYKKNDLVDQQNQLYKECRKLYLFIEGGNPNLKQLRRESLFVELLEILDPNDADLLLAVKDKKMPYPNMSEDFIRKVFPGILP